MQTFLEFDSADEAIAYRREHGTGGWIFARECDGKAVIFPWEMLPNAILVHPMAKGNGELIGCT